ncbi:MAG: NCS2 family permease [Bacteroidales bacterium]|nr:NCS2 family permease [Bacteroidales bacterium]MBQ2599142.1 NCS2 family permease [Bacteroidales bacterium]
MSNFLTKAFGFDPAKHTVRTELIAGLTTFLTMAYILAVNPSIFSALPGMPSGSVFTATALAAIIATLVMAFWAKKPFALAPGMGLNAFFVFTVCLTMGHSWQFALTAVLIEGVIFVILTLTKVRTWILEAIPLSLKHAIGAGIGLFIAFIGLQNAGLIVNSDATLVTLGDITHGTGLLAVIGLVISCVLVMLHIRGGILWGILATAILGLVIKDPATGQAITHFNGVVSIPDSVAPIAFKFQWGEIFTWDMLAVVFTFLFIDMFDTMGTVIGVSQKAGFVDEKGKIQDAEKVFMADAIGTIAGACLGTSTTTTYVESSAGVGAGGRTGLTAFAAAACFALALFFSPVFLAIPGAATAPALIIVGMMMMNPVREIDWTNYRESIPAFLTVILMPLAYSISDGILIGVISYVVLYALTGKAKQITPTMWVLAVLFILRYIFI